MQRNVPHPLQPLHPPPAPAPIAGGGAGQGGHQACASCRHQRKKCSENCDLAPYFPADRTREFGLVHKVYGVSNLTKMVRANESIAERLRCAQTLIWEATWRNMDFANGCYNEVMRLKNEIASLRAVIANCGSCSRQPLPEPYRSPVPQPVPLRAYGNNHHDGSNNNGSGNLIREGIDNNNNNNNGGMHVGGVVPQQHITNYPLNNGNLIHGYHNPHPPLHMLISQSVGEGSGGLAQSNYISRSGGEGSGRW